MKAIAWICYLVFLYGFILVHTLSLPLAAAELLSDPAPLSLGAFCLLELLIIGNVVGTCEWGSRLVRWKSRGDRPIPQCLRACAVMVVSILCMAALTGVYVSLVASATLLQTIGVVCLFALPLIVTVCLVLSQSDFLIQSGAARRWITMGVRGRIIAAILIIGCNGLLAGWMSERQRVASGGRGCVAYNRSRSAGSESSAGGIRWVWSPNPFAGSMSLVGESPIMRISEAGMPR